MSIPWKCLSILFLAGLLACATSNPDASTGDGGDPAPPAGCEAGLSQDCFCADGNSGSQVCNDEGTAFDDCICLQTPPDATSDSGGGGEDVSEDNGNSPLPFPGEDGGGPPQGGGPQSCDSQADCDAEGGCPDDAALGCECVQGQNGQQRCIPRCETDEDCPTPGNPNITLTCNNNGLCRPGQGQGGEPPEPEPETDDCENDEDCAVEGACNPNAVLGCTCMATPNGTLGCRPKCETAEDCPTPPNNPDFQVLCTDDGVCQPNNGGGGEEPEPEPEPTGPPTCETAADCEAVCPAAATMGCGCTETPNGEMVCRIKCETTDDCPIPPNNPNANPQCTDDGYCMGGNQGGGSQAPQ